MKELAQRQAGSAWAPGWRLQPVLKVAPFPQADGQGAACSSLELGGHDCDHKVVGRDRPVRMKEGAMGARRG